MQITTRALVVAVALLASAPLLAADSGTSMADIDASTQETRATTAQDNCTPPALSPTDLDKLASLLPKPGSTPPDPAEVDRRLSKAASCARTLGLRAPGEDTTTSTTAKETTDSTSNRATAATQSSSPAGL